MRPPRALPLRAAVALAVLLLGLSAAPVMPRAQGAVSDPASEAIEPWPAPQLREALPRPGTVVATGTLRLSVEARWALLAVAQLSLDGQALPTATIPGPDATTISATADVSAGSHVAAVTVRLPDGSRHERRWRFEASDLAVPRVAGGDRIATAVAVARRAFPAGAAPAAVLARADHFADALAGAPLAAALEGPLLLNGFDGLHARTAAALQQLLAEDATVHLLGGTAVLPVQLERDLRRAGFGVKRHAGATRYATAVAVAEELEDRLDTLPSRVVLASGEDFPDALAAAVPAAMNGWPVLLTRAGALPEVTAAYLHDRRGAIDRIELVGGLAAVSPAVETSLSGASVRRTAGASRFDTAAMVAGRFLPAGSAGVSDGVLLASGASSAEALAGAVLGARTGTPLLLAGEDLAASSTAALRDRGTGRVTVLGGPGAVPERVVDDVRRVLHDAGAGGTAQIDPPAGSVVVEPLGAAHPADLILRLPGVDLDDRTQVTVLIDDREAPIVVRRESDTVRVALLGMPLGVRAVDELPLTVVAGLHGANRSAHVSFALRLRRAAPTAMPEGFLALPGFGTVVGEAGVVRTYSLEVEAGIAEDLRAFADEAEAALSAPRGWTAQDRWRLQRVPAAVAQVRVVLAQPDTVDAYCRAVGLDTGGIYSCWTGRFAMLNLDRWRAGASGFAGALADYRRYLVNHEVGHALGHGHDDCPAGGVLAPLMMQQTKGTGACLPNPWPYP